MLIPPELNIDLQESVADNAQGARKVSPASAPTTTSTTRLCTSIRPSVRPSVPLMSRTNWKAAQVASRPQFAFAIAFASAQQFKVLSARCQCQSDRIAWGSPSWTNSASPVASCQLQRQQQHGSHCSNLIHRSPISKSCQFCCSGCHVEQQKHSAQIKLDLHSPIASGRESQRLVHAACNASAERPLMQQTHSLPLSLSVSFFHGELWPNLHWRKPQCELSCKFVEQHYVVKKLCEFEIFNIYFATLCGIC